MKKVLFIQHGETDVPGIFADVMASRGISVDILRPDLGQPVPQTLSGYSGLALGGGGQSVYEKNEYPYLAAESVLVRKGAEAEGKPVLGLCLGGQLMAAAFGAQVRPAAQKEIGLFEVTLERSARHDPLWHDMPSPFVAAHWHGDVFDIPPGGIRLGSSRLTPNQLFRYGRAFYGLQFHLEMTPEIFAAMIDESAAELAAEGFDGNQLKAQAEEWLPKLEEKARTVFGRWADLLGE